ncbi:hypothetical protein [Streptomyces caatingaensis]|uniref:Uncharacterized protein n=1 Tax=Streptomyces caatingaensis TaxID=1678637 RepID=A0A0K9XC26_9ACTN|nr:hypothetical protein [Streptomyces caatingaensis]KNB50192.1 hypothetical protein AC230_26260 [Streptomyces caatingaensis]
MTQQAEPDSIPDGQSAASGRAPAGPSAQAGAASSPGPAEPASGNPAEPGPAEPGATGPAASPGAAGPGRADGFGAAFCASMATLCAEFVVAATAGVLVLLGREHDGLPTAPLMAAAVGLGALLLTVLISGFVTAAGVMPALALARRAARRAGREGSGGRGWTAGAVPVVAAAAVAVFGAVAALGSLSLARPLSYLLWWASLTVALLPPALVARAAARRVREGRMGSVARRVTRDGAVVWLAVGAIGALVYGTGLADVYHPPRLHKSDIAGVWSDGRNGSVTLEKGGRAVAEGLDNFDWDGMGKPRARDCDGAGTWSPLKDGGKIVGVSVQIEACEFRKNWSVSGTTKEPRLFHEIGKQGSGKRYVLTKVAGKK